MRKNITWLTVWASTHILSPNCSCWNESTVSRTSRVRVLFLCRRHTRWSRCRPASFSTSTWLCVIGAHQPTHLSTLSRTNIVSYPREGFLLFVNRQYILRRRRRRRREGFFNRGTFLSFECWRPLLGCLMRIVFWYIKMITFKTERTRITGPGFILNTEVVLAV